MEMDDFVFKIKADFLAALANPARLKIIELLKNGEISVGKIAEGLQMPQSSVSKHLMLLKQAGVLRARQEKVTVYYRIQDPAIFSVLKPVSAILKKRLKESQGVLAHLGSESSRG